MSEVRILCDNNGPYRITGDIVLTDAQGNQFDLSGRERVALCRCGQSNNKPFCDGAHRNAGFQSEVEAR
jgi:CDGSH-type Zn-finger protein